MTYCGRLQKKAKEGKRVGSWENKDEITDPEGQGLLPSELETAVWGAMDAGAAGICLFSANSMTPDHWAALDRLTR